MKNSSPTPEFEQLVRNQLSSLADQAPTSVRSIDDVALEPVATPKRTKGRIAAIGASVIALGGGLTLTGIAATGGQEAGANTPEQAVTELLEAIENRDVLGALDVLDPGESDALIHVAEQALTEGARTGLLSEGADLGNVTGSDVGIDGLTMSTEQIAGDLAVVNLDAGIANIGFDLQSLPFGDPLTNVINGQPEPPPSTSTTTVDLAEEDFGIATVQRGERWYVSIGYTIAEAVRGNAELPFPTATLTTPEGFDSPQAAANEFWMRAAALDVDGLIALAAPGETDALARYAPLWLASANEGIDSAHAEGLNITVSGLTLDESGDDDRRRLTPTTYVIEGTLPDAGFDDAPPHPEFDPDLPTVIYGATDGGYVIPAGEPIPTSFDDVELVPGDTLFDSFAGPTNEAFLQPDGTLFPLWSDGTEPEQVAGPRSFRFDYSDGCTTVSGDITVDNQAFGQAPTDFERFDDGSYRVCDDASNPLNAVTLLVFVGQAGTAPTIPAIEAVEVDGLWYISPVGSAATAILQFIERIDDGQAFALDSPVSSLVIGFSSDQLLSFMTGQTADDLGPECAAIAEFDDNGIIARISPDATLPAAQNCISNGQLFGGSGGPFGSDVEISVGAEVEEAPVVTD